jgi:transcriptional regulator with XRE-family HTH domain
MATPPALSPGPPHRRLGQRLRAGRQAIPGLTVTLLAAIVGVTPATIYQYEGGHHRPRRIILTQLATVLGLDRTAVHALAGYPPPRPAAKSPDRRRRSR